MSRLCCRRTTRTQQDGNVVARHIHDLADGVRGPDRHMQHDGSRLAGDAIVTVRHRHCQILVWYRDECRIFLFAGARQHFDDRREVCAGIGKHVFDTASGEPS